MRIFLKILTLSALVWGLSDHALAQSYISTPYLTPASPQTIQNGDLIPCTRGGVTYNCIYPGVFPIATLSTVGMVYPGTGLTVNAYGALSSTITGGSFTVALGTTTTPVPYVSGNNTSGFYGAASSGNPAVENNAVAVEQWNTLASGVDYLNVYPGKSGTAPKISVSGPTGNQGLNLTGTGTGSVTINGLAINSSSIVTAGTWQGTGIANTYLANSAVTIGSTSLSLGSSATSITGLASLGVTATTASLPSNGIYSPSAGQLVATTSGVAGVKIDATQHTLYNSALSMTVTSGSSACGTAPSIAGTDEAFRITVGSSTNGGVCPVKFNAAWVNIPSCQCHDETAAARAAAYALSVTTTAAIITAGSTYTAGDTVSCLCGGWF